MLLYNTFSKIRATLGCFFFFFIVAEGICHKKALFHFCLLLRRFEVKNKIISKYSKHMNEYKIIIHGKKIQPQNDSLLGVIYVC